MLLTAGQIGRSAIGAKRASCFIVSNLSKWCVERGYELGETGYPQTVRTYPAFDAEECASSIPRSHTTRTWVAILVTLWLI
jgi:hypothetical protein